MTTVLLLAPSVRLCCKGSLLRSILFVKILELSMRLILRQPPRTRSEPLRQRLGWTSLHQRRHHALLKQVHRCINKRAPVYLVEKFQTNSNFGYCGTRGEGKLNLKRPLSNFIVPRLSFKALFILTSYLIVLEHYLVQKLLLLHLK